MTFSSTSDSSNRKAELAGVFDRAAASYDQVGPPVFAEFGRRLVEYAGLRSGQTVLDVACGSGALLLPAAQTLGFDGLITGVDLSSGMLRQASARVVGPDLAVVQLLQMDAENLAFPDASFDVVFCGFAIFFFPDLLHAITEMRRVLRPGGTLALSVWSKTRDPAWGELDTLINQFLPPRPDDQTTRQGYTTLQLDLRTPSGLTRLLTGASFSDIQVQGATYRLLYRDLDEWWATQWSHGGRGYLERIQAMHGPEGVERYKDAAFGLLTDLQRNGSLTRNLHAYFVRAINPG